MTYNIGEKIQLKGVDRCNAHNGYDVYLDPPLDIDGTIVAVANFIDRRVCIEFPINHQKHTVWKYEFDLPAKT
jgi:hypothetical protein